MVKALDEDVLEYDAAIGLGSSFSETIAVEFKVEASQYETGIAWLRDLLWGSEFSLERLRVAAAKLAQSLPEQKRDGRAVSWALSRSMLFSECDSTSLANSILMQARIVPEIVTMLHQSPDRVLEKFEVIRRTLLHPDALRVSVSVSYTHLTLPTNREV